jgi:hypothetical protein
MRARGAAQGWCFSLQLRLVAEQAVVGGGRTVILVGQEDQAKVHIPEASGQGFRFNVGAHSGVTWAHIPA